MELQKASLIRDNSLLHFLLLEKKFSSSKMRHFFI